MIELYRKRQPTIFEHQQTITGYVSLRPAPSKDRADAAINALPLLFAGIDAERLVQDAIARLLDGKAALPSRRRRDTSPPRHLRRCPVKSRFHDSDVPVHAFGSDVFRCTIHLGYPAQPAETSPILT